ncbi:MAG: hypothetical protein ABIG87_00600 [Patescibacteria group bacterium]
MFKTIFKKTILILVSLFVIYSVNLATGAGENVLDIDAKLLNFERIIFVPGINTQSFKLSQWKTDLQNNFPQKEIIFLDDPVYFYWQDEKTEEIVEKGVALLNDGKATLVISHSYGGVLAETMISRADNGNVIKLITMASPHQMDSFGIDNSKEFLGTPDKVNVPTYSFGGYIDPVVLFPNTNVQSSNHQDLWSGHLGFLLDKDIRRKVLEFALGFNYVE